MYLREKSIRIFISSTFEDMAVERDVLQERVYPKLIRECASKGWQLELVDLRWGISFDAGVQQKTMSICLKELNRCIDISPRPNFFVMLGNRYGWRPIPDLIDVDQWNEILAFVDSESDRKLLESNYEEDLNNIPSQRLLIKRKGKYITDTSLYQSEVVDPLLKIFFAFGMQFRQTNERLYIKYCTSATHQEIYDGALSRKLIGWQAVAFFRNITDADTNPSFCDSTDKEFCKEELAKVSLKLKDAIDNSFENRDIENEERYINCNISLEEYRSNEYKDYIEDNFTRMLQRVIEREMGEYESSYSDKWNVDRQYQARFAQERIKLFKGRDSEIATLLNKLKTDNPILLYGGSGSGKSALLAKLGDEICDSKRVIYTSIGISPLSNSGRNVLISILRELFGDNNELHTKSFDEIKHIFNRQLIEYNGNECVIIIDALDQLPSGDALQHYDWGVFKGCQNIKIIVSQIENFSVKDIYTYKVPALALNNDLTAVSIFETMLGEYGRKVTVEQLEKVIEAYRRGGSYPLFLRIMAVVASRWMHNDTVVIGEVYSETENIVGSKSIVIPTTVDKLVCGILEESSEEHFHGRILVREVISFIFKSCRGVSDGEILSLLAMSDDYIHNFRKNSLHPYKSTINAFPPILWTRFYYDIKNMLTERLAIGGHVLNFYHRQVSEGAKLFLEKRPTCEHYKLMSSYFNTQWQVGVLRALEELPSALLGAEDIKELINVLTDIDFIQYSASQGLTFDILQRYRDAIYKIDKKIELFSHEDVSLRANMNYTDTAHAYDYAMILHSRYVLNMLYEFILMESYQFETYASRNDIERCGGNNRFALQFFYNAFANGPIHNLAAEYIKKNRDYLPVLYLRSNSAQYLENPAIVKKLRRHGWCIRALDVSNDFKLGVSVDDEKCCATWNIETGKMVNSFFFHSAQVISCRMDNNFEYVLTSSSDGEVILWNISTGIIREKLKIDFSNKFVGADLSKDLSLSVAAADNKIFISRDFKKWNEIKFDVSVSVVRICDATKNIAIGFVDGSVCVVDSYGNITTTLSKEHIMEIKAIEFANSGQFMVFASADGYWSLWRDGVFVNRNKRAFGRAINAIKITPDAKYVLTGDDDNSVTLWDIENGCSRDYFGHTKDVTALFITDDGSKAFSGSRDRLCIEWDLSTDCQNVNNTLHSSCVYLTPSIENRVYSVSDNGVLALWDCAKGESTVVESVDFPIECFAADIHSSGRELLLSLGNNDCMLYGVDKKSREIIKTSHSGFVNSVRFTKDGKYALTNGIDKDGRGVGDILCYIDLSCNKIVSSYDDAALGVEKTPRYEKYRLNTPDENKYYVIHINGAYGIAVSPDNTFVAVACRDNTVALFDYKAGRVIKKLGVGAGYHTNEVKSVVFTPDGRRLISGSWDNNCIVWDCQSGEMIHRLEGSMRGIYALDVSADGRTLLAGDRGNCVVVWDIDSGKIINRYVGNSPCNSVQFIENGFIAGFDSGDVAIVKNSINQQLKGLSYSTITRMWDNEMSAYGAPTAICPHCGANLPINQDILIVLESSENLNYPILELDDAKWDNRHLTSLCSCCRNRVKLNPYIV